MSIEMISKVSKLLIAILCLSTYNKEKFLNLTPSIHKTKITCKNHFQYRCIYISNLYKG